MLERVSKTAAGGVEISLIRALLKAFFGLYGKWLKMLHNLLRSPLADLPHLIIYTAEFWREKQRAVFLQAQPKTTEAAILVLLIFLLYVRSPPFQLAKEPAGGTAELQWN